MMNYLNIFLTTLCISISSNCFDIKTFFFSKEQQYTIIGNKTNRYFNVKHVAPFDPKILKVNYIDTIREILIKHIDEENLNDIDKNAEIFVSIYYDPHSLKISELYFGFRRVNPLEVVTVKKIQKIEKEIKQKLIGEKDTKRFNAKEVDDTLAKLTYLDGHGIGFYLKQLIQYKRGEIPKESLTLR